MSAIATEVRFRARVGAGQSHTYLESHLPICNPRQVI